MGKLYDRITDKQRQLIEASPLFFVASVHPELSDTPSGAGPVNVSPKGGTRLHVLDPNRVAYLDYPGSGNETARHAAGGGPITAMVMSFGSEDAAIVRLYGRASVSPVDGSDLAERLLADPATHLAKKPRQVITIDVDRTQTSCGYGVPIYEYVGQRTSADRGRAYKEPKPTA
jgi:predicted pyridoxine 5'-phosphate oxidase superfamily flavin-nucleotide-binding protein